MAMLKAATRSMQALPRRMTLDLIIDIFEIMLGNMGMSEQCIMEYMTESKGFLPSQIGQLKQALKLAVDMGLVTYRDDRYLFTMKNLEGLVAHKNNDDNEAPRSPMPGPSNDPRFTMATSGHKIPPAGRKKRTISSRAPTSQSKRQRPSHSKAPPHRSAHARTTTPRRGIRKAYRPSPVVHCCRSSTSSLPSNYSRGSMDDCNRRCHRKIQTSRARTSMRKCPMKRSSGGVRHGSVYKKALQLEARRTKGLPLKRNATKMGKARPKKPNRSSGTHVAAKTKRASLKNRLDETNACSSRARGSRQSKAIPKKRKSAVSTSQTKCKKPLSVASKNSVATTKTGKTASSEQSGSTTGSRKMRVPKIPSRTSRKSDEPAGGCHKSMRRRSTTASILQEFLTSSFVAKKLEMQESVSSIGSKCSDVSKVTSSKASINSDETEVVPAKKAKVAPQRRSTAGRGLRPTDSCTSIASKVSQVSKTSSKLSSISQDTPGGTRKNRGKKPDKVESSLETIPGPQDSVSSIESSNASKSSSKQSIHTEESTESVGKGRGDGEPKQNLRKSARTAYSATTVGSKASSLSSRSSSRSELSGDRSRQTKKPEANSPTPLKPETKKSNTSIASKGNGKEATKGNVKEATKVGGKEAVKGNGKDTTKGNGKETTMTTATGASFARNPKAPPPQPSRPQKGGSSKSCDDKEAVVRGQNVRRGPGGAVAGPSHAAPRMRSATRFIGINPTLIDDEDEMEDDSRALHDFYR